MLPVLHARTVRAMAACMMLLPAIVPIAARAEATLVSLAPANVPTGLKPISLTLPLQRSGDLQYDVLLHYSTPGDTAQPGVDYVDKSDVLTLLAGSTDSSIQVDILPHPAPGADTTLALAIESAVGLAPVPVFSPSSVATGETVRDLAIADFNGDGRPDVAAVGAQLAVMINTTALGANIATYSTQLTVVLPNTPCCVITADFNADHRPDLAVLDGLGRITVLLNTTTQGASTATFAAQTPIVAGAHAMAAMDLNGDRRPEIVATSSTTNSVSVFPNLAAGGFGAAQTFDVGAPQADVVLADLNGDGAVDIVVSEPSQDRISILPATATAGVIGFQAVQHFTVGDAPVSLALADVNGDGRIDVICADTTQQNFGVLRNLTVPGSATLSLLGSYFSAFGTIGTLTTADLNGDGHGDLLFVTAESPVLTFRQGRTAAGAGVIDFDINRAASSQNWSTRRIAVSDVNGDGLPDLVGIKATLDGIVVEIQSAPPVVPAFGFSGLVPFSSGFSTFGIAVADFTLDGLSDLAAANDGSNTVSILRNTTPPGSTVPSFTLALDLPGGSDPNAIASADLNGDGKPDLVVTHSFGGLFSVWLNTSTPGAPLPTFTTEQTFAIGVGLPTAVVLADVNGDGKLDVLMTVDDPDNVVSVRLNSTPVGASTVTLSAPFNFATDARPNALAVNDLNGDGRPDLMATSFTGNTVSILFNTTALGATTPTFAARTTLVTGSIPTGVASADLNGDGRADLLVANSDTHPPAVMAWINTTAPLAATPSFGTPQSFSISVTSSASLTTGDVDGDGRPDAIVGNTALENITVLRNTTAPGATLASFAARRAFGTGGPTAGVAAGDFNGDGKIDLVAGKAGSNLLSVMLNTQYQVSTDGNPAVITLVNDHLFGNGFD